MRSRLISTRVHEEIQGRPEFRCCRGALRIVHCPGKGIPRSIRWASTISRTPTESHQHVRADLHYYGMRSRNCGQDTRRACAVDRSGHPRFLLPRGEQCGVQHEMSWCSFSVFAMRAMAIGSPRRATTFRPPSLICDSLRAGFFLPIACAGGWLAVLACQFPTRAAHGQAR